jgi:hypothetical protein
MDAALTVTAWPGDPYRGLDFYHEADAALFRERDDDIRDCTEWLLSYGLKILLLQGSSGSGKSSFLRAKMMASCIFSVAMGSFAALVTQFRRSPKPF